MELDRCALKNIADQYGMKHLGYYVMLHLFGPFNPSKMASKCKISQGQCRKIEQDLVSMGLLQVSGVGRGRVVKLVRSDVAVDKDAKELLVEFAARTGKDLGASEEWYQRQYKVAQDLVEKFGHDACMFMLDYALAKGTDLYSLNFLDAVSGDLIPKYEMHKELKENAQKLDGKMWNELHPVKIKEKRDTATEDDIDDILSAFDIEI
jgi:hypothetical protein